MLDIFDFADIICVDIKITRYANQNNRWTAKFERTEIRDNGVLRGVYGNGTSPRTAIEDYIKKIKGKLLVANAMSKTHRKEFGVPDNLYIEDKH